MMLTSTIYKRSGPTRSHEDLINKGWLYRFIEINEIKYVVAICIRTKSHRVNIEITKRWTPHISFMSSNEYLQINFDNHIDALKFYETCDPAGVYATVKVFNS